MLLHWNVKNLEGHTFERLHVLRPAGHRTSTNGDKALLWMCRCVCGKIKIATGYCLRSGKTRSCGCLRRDSYAQRTKHGMTDSPEYRVWTGMLSRARGTSKDSDNRRYHDRGIGVTKRWNDFRNFLQDMGKRPSPHHQLDRKNNDRGYSKKNCRWALPSTQARNKRNSLFLNVRGRRLPLIEWAQLTGIRYATLHSRLRRGLAPQEIISPNSRHTGGRIRHTASKDPAMNWKTP